MMELSPNEDTTKKSGNTSLEELKTVEVPSVKPLNSNLALAPKMVEATVPVLSNLAQEQAQLLKNTPPGASVEETTERLGALITQVHKIIKNQGVEVKELTGSLVEDGAYVTKLYRDAGLHLELETVSPAEGRKVIRASLEEIDLDKSGLITIENPLLEKLGIVSKTELPLISVKKNLFSSQGAMGDISVPATVAGKVSTNAFGEQNTLVYEERIAQIAKASGQDYQSLRNSIVANEASQVLLTRSIPGISSVQIEETTLAMSPGPTASKPAIFSGRHVVEAFSDYSSLLAGMDPCFYIKHLAAYSSNSVTIYELSQHILNKALPRMSQTNPPVLSRNRYSSVDELILDIKIRGQTREAGNVLIKQFEEDLGSILKSFAGKRP